MVHLDFFHAPAKPMPPLMITTIDAVSSRIDSVLSGVAFCSSEKPSAHTLCAPQRYIITRCSMSVRALAASTAAKPGSRE